MTSKLDNSYGNGHYVTASTQPVAEEPSPSEVEELQLKPSHDITRATWAIVGALALPCIPILVVITVLLYFIFRHRLVLSPGWPALQISHPSTHDNTTQLLNLIRQQGGRSAYYVMFNATTITTIASWTGRFIPYLSSSIMALVAFYAARHIVLKSKHGDGSDLPSPEQLTILIGVLGGNGFGPLKDTLLYKYRKRENLISPLPAASTALFVITILGILIPIIDSWFGIATKTVIVTQLYPRSSLLNFGRGLSTSVCPDGPRDYHNPKVCNLNKNTWWPCNIPTAPNCQYPVITSMSDASQLSLGLSEKNKINNYTDSSGQTFYYLTDPAALGAEVDYKARTIATSSQCVPMTKRCSLPELDNGNVFNCTSDFNGVFSDPMLQIIEAKILRATDFLSWNTPLDGASCSLGFSKNPQLTEVGAVELQYADSSQDADWGLPQIYETNPLYYGVWASGYPPGDPKLTFPASDTGIQYHQPNDGVVLQGGGIWLLNCSTTVYDVDYTWIDGQVHSFDPNPASTDMAALLSAPLAFSGFIPYVQETFSSIATIAGTKNSSQAIAASFSGGISTAFLSYSIGAMSPKLNEYEQLRNSSISVTRIPMVPLYLLISTKVTYILAVIILAIGAYCFTHPAETEFVKAQLSVKGLAAAHFQQPDLAQKNSVKELQKRIDVAKGKAAPAAPPQTEESESPTLEKGIARAATAPVNGSDNAHAPPKNGRVGILPGKDGTWQFVMVADGVWNSIKPIVKNVIVSDADTGGLGMAGEVIRAW